MSNTILCGILNYGRIHKDMKKIVSKLPGDVIVCTDNPDFWGKTETIEAVESIAASKNKIIDHAINNNYDYVFIIEDDLLPSKKQAILEYKYMMDKLKLGGIMYGYGSQMNKVFGTRPNASLIIKDFDGNDIYVNRFPCSSLIGLKVNKDMVKFDERLVMLETDFLFLDMKEKGLYPFSGFYFDINKSWERFHTIDVETKRKKTLALVNKDKEVRKATEIKPDFSADLVLNYINKSIGN